jgi:hypothetical protein
MMQKAEKNPKWKTSALGGVLLFVGIGGLAGGVPMVLDPSGAGLGMKLAVLAGSPFSSYLIPGLVVLIINGLLPCVLGIAAIRSHRRSGDMGIGYGIWLIGYMGAQVWWIGLIAGIQYLFLAIGFITLFLGVLVRKQIGT